MKSHRSKGRSDGRHSPQGPSQRQLRAGELIRHALVEVMHHQELPGLDGVSVTITQVRLSPDLRHAAVFVEPLGGGHAPEVVDALNRHTRFLRGRLGHGIDMKFTPELKFLHDESFDEAERMARLFDDPRVQADLAKTAGEPDAPEDGTDDGS